MREIVPGIVHWTAMHEPIGTAVSSYYIVPAGAVIDPKVPSDGLDALPGRPDAVLLTSGHHVRDAPRFAETFQIPIRGSRPAAEHAGTAVAIETVNDGDEPAPGITAIQVAQLSADEGAYHIVVDGIGALAIADGIQHYDDELGFFPDSLLGDDPEQVKRSLKRAFNRLLALHFDTLLFAHGDPIARGGKHALREFVIG